MSPKKKKNAAAQALNALRWKGVKKADRLAHASEMGKASAAALTPEQRVTRAKKAAAARVAKKRKKS